MIRNIWCVGRNYVDHIREMKTEISQEPIVFLKAGSCYVPSHQVVHIPTFSKNVQYEAELALRFDDNLRIDRVSTALDITARDMQQKAKEDKGPWTLSKSFRQSCPIGEWMPVEHMSFLKELTFSLRVNGKLIQKGSASDMVFPCEVLVEYLLRHFPVCPGDVLLTGTPSGVAPIKKNDTSILYLNDQEVGHWQFQ